MHNSDYPYYIPGTTYYGDPIRVPNYSDLGAQFPSGGYLDSKLSELIDAMNRLAAALEKKK